MVRLAFGISAFIAGLALIVSPVSSQPGSEKGPKGAVPKFELGQIFPPPLVEDLKLTEAQVKELEAIKKELKAKLEKLLTTEQKKAVENFRPRGPGGPGGPGEKGPKEKGPGEKGGKDPVSDAAPMPRVVHETTAKLSSKGSLKIVGSENSPFKLTGDATEGVLGDPSKEFSGTGIRLLSGDDVNKDGSHTGSLTCTLTGLTGEKGRWFRVHLRALAQENFTVDQDDLFINVEFFKDNGKNSLDHIKKSIYPQVELERKSLADAGTNKNLGSATWRDFTIAVRTPFPEVDTLQVSVGFGHGTGKARKSEFWISELEVTPIADPANYLAPAPRSGTKNPPALQSLVKLGGRWYYDPRGGSKEPPTQFDHTNVDRLYYFSDRLETPFVGNTSAWLRQGYLDYEGNPVTKDQFIEDAVVISFTEKHLVMKSKNLPNHPTGTFPDRSRLIDGNPNIIKEQRDTWKIPLEPKVNPSHVAMTMENKNALPMGPIGVMLNGVVFYNPFDHIAEADAVWRLDRCCGHPSPTSSYHYHKYPVCINTPWADDGSDHSPLIGFSFDGFPVYGPYEAKGILAKDSKENPLNEFNLHEDPVRGPHYHVTPGKFPHILGGYWGEVDTSNRPAKKGFPKK